VASWVRPNSRLQRTRGPAGSAAEPPWHLQLARQVGCSSLPPSCIVSRGNRPAALPLACDGRAPLNRSDVGLPTDREFDESASPQDFSSGGSSRRSGMCRAAAQVGAAPDSCFISDLNLGPFIFRS